MPVREWLADNFFPRYVPSLVTGHGGDGKSLLMLQLAIARAIGRQWLGMHVPPGRTVVLSAEDDEDELHRRIAGIVAYYDAQFSDLEGLFPVDLVGQDAVLGTLDRTTNTIVPTQLFDAADKVMRDTGADLLVIDALADAFAGLENDRPQAR